MPPTLRNQAGPESYFPGTDTRIEFKVGRGDSTTDHAEQQLLNELGPVRGNNVRLVNFFTERTPCTMAMDGDIPCRTFMQQTVPQFLNPGQSFVLYYLTTPGTDSAGRVVTQYAALGLPLT